MAPLTIPERIAECCKRLRLSRNLAQVAGEIEARTPQEYLLAVLEKEVEHREQLRKEKLIKQAGFYGLKTLEDFSFDEVRLPGGLSPAALAAGTFVKEQKNLILYGNVGTGKTHLAQALGLLACQRGQEVRFYRTAALVNRLGEAQKKGELERFLKQLFKAELIICDEWGYIPLERDGSKLLFRVISDCYEQRSVVITTNLEFSRWVNVFYDEQMTTAMIDRLVHHGYLLIFDGESYRVKNSLMKEQG